MDIRVGRMGADKLYARVRRSGDGFELAFGYEKSESAAIKTVVTREDMIALIGAFETAMEAHPKSDALAGE